MLFAVVLILLPTLSTSLPWLETSQRSLQEGLDCTPYESLEPEGFAEYTVNEDLDMVALDTLKVRRSKEARVKFIFLRVSD